MLCRVNVDRIGFVTIVGGFEGSHDYHGEGLMLFSKFPNYECSSPIDSQSLLSIDFRPSMLDVTVFLGDREITYQLQTLYKSGAYNSTIRLDFMQPIFDYMAETKAIRFRRVSRNARLIIEQSNRSKGKNVFAWANGNKISLSPDANYGRSVYTTAVVLCHEFLHCAGGSLHSKKAEPLMAANGGTTGGFTALDEPWWRAYAWRGSARPEVGGLKKRFGSVQTLEGRDLSVEEVAIEKLFSSRGCGCEMSWIERFFGVMEP